jgi:tetratricopeptide (TPR) repeat protein
MEGVPGIPHAFVIDQKGVVVWAGHPMAGLDEVVEKVVAGKFDMAKSKQTTDLEKEMQSLFQSNDPDQIGPAADKLLAVAPGNSNGLDAKCWCLKNKKDKDVAAYKAFFTQLLTKIDDDWRALNGVAWKLANDEDLAWRDPATALKAAKRGVEVSQSKEGDILDTLARVYFETGMLDQAIDTQKKALALDDKNEDYKKVLDYYQSCAAVRKQAGGAAPKKS